MDVLPKDVIDIVYRYLFVHTYTKVVQEYSIIWLDDCPDDYWTTRSNLLGGSTLIYWNDLLECFHAIDYRYSYPLANYRELNDDEPFRCVHTFKEYKYGHLSYERYSGISLSPHYVHQQLPKSSYCHIL
jgi:hypothetical protein